MGNLTSQSLIKRIVIVSLISFMLVLIVSEFAYWLQTRKGDIDRSPKTIELVIPEGTAQRVEGGSAVPAIPDEMIFIVGDVLVVRNKDIVAHQLGPMIIPAGSSASMPLDNRDNLLLSCSFQSDRYMGFEIIEATTMWTRLSGLSFAVPATFVLLFIYSLVAFPENKSFSRQ